MYKVKEVADLAGISVRTLHHYDSIGLLKPKKIEENGYRYYNDDDLERLQQILFFKELEVPLVEIQRIIDHPSFDRKHALVSHRSMMLQKKHRLERLIHTVEETLQSMKGAIAMTKEDMFEPFDMAEIEEHQKKYEQEVEEKYGHTDAYKESQEKTSTYTADDWKQIKHEWDSLYKQIAERMDKGPADEEVQALISEYRSLITANFYNCTLEIFRGLGDLYTSDPRFTKNIDKVKPGLSSFLQQAMHIYCDRQ
ncbi:MerR family transcriptional regulator [Paenibacillus assamensis]|uniref:MerR family transcriptional regulator n=1 Tax=Paenibacillus assamensis TaxID=311244 RepID=UPI000401357E|nr:MerR family transcriptional regulator [Paenibacillus assamensis]